MSLDTRGGDVAEAVHRLTSQPVVFFHETWMLHIPLPGRETLKLPLPDDPETSTEEMAKAVCDLWRDFASETPQTWPKARRQLTLTVDSAKVDTTVMHVTRLSDNLHVFAGIRRRGYWRPVLNSSARAFGVSPEDLIAAAMAAMKRRLTPFPGKVTPSPRPDRASLITFRNTLGLGSGLAYAYALSVPEAAAAFLTPDAAFVIETTDLAQAQALLEARRSFEHTVDDMPVKLLAPEVHLFQHGEHLGELV